MMIILRLSLLILIFSLPCIVQRPTFGQDKAGEKSVRSILSDRNLWNAAGKNLQDKTILAVAKKLGSAYKFVETKEYHCNKQKHRIATFQHIKSGILLNLIPGGTYVMGAKDGNLDEKPAHSVTIKAMLVGKFEVTQDQWQKIAGKNPSRFKAVNKPVENVRWNDMKNWFLKSGGQLRLPSESEWEYACRGGTTSKYFWGNKVNKDYFWYTANSKKQTHSVLLHAEKSNAFGLSDMSGNVAEWCQDRMISHYKDGPNNSEPRLKGSSSYRVNRGGNWKNNSGDCRSAWRASYSPFLQNDAIGFRAFRSLN